MFKLIILFCSSLFLCIGSVWADTLDTATIQRIHSELKTGFIEKCKTEMKDATDAICSCLADKAQANLDDKALSLCTNDDSGNKCVMQIVYKATLAAFSKENINFCMPAGTTPQAVTPSVNSAPATTPTATTPVNPTSSH